MNSIRERDLRSALQLLQEVGACAGDWRSFARAGVSALPSLVASEITTLSVCDLRSVRRQVIASPGCAIGDAERACFDRYFAVHPLVRYHAFERGEGVHRISDSQSNACFRETALYNEYYRRIRIDHVVALPIQVDSNVLVSFVLNRSRRDFSDRDREVLDLVRVNLAQMYRRACALEALRGLSVAALPDSMAATLTPRECDVLHWLRAGKTDRDIGTLLGCSHRTVQKHLQRVYTKLGVETRTAAVMRMQQQAPHH